VRDPSSASTAFADRPIGPHLQLSGGLLRAAERARAIGATAVQIFVDNPTAWRRKPEPPPEVDEFRRRLAQAGIVRIAVHASYLINLGSPDPDFWERSIDTLGAELSMALAYGASMVNVHIGSHLGRGMAEGIDRVGAGVARVLADAADVQELPVLVLENSAGAGGTLGATIPEIAEVLAAAERHGADGQRIGVCLDTAHLWGAGYDLADPGAIDHLLQDVDAELGGGRLRMMHFNDSRASRGSRQDRHEHIGAGMIGTTGLAHLLTHPSLAAIPTFLETPGMDAGYDGINLERVRSLIRGERLEPLANQAFTTRSGRPRKQAAPDRRLPEPS
jgi:deoxyribonuclease IV